MAEALMRTVGVLDVLGFKERIKAGPLAELSSRYERAIEVTEQHLPDRLMDPGDEPTMFSASEPSPLCHRYIFSDTVVLISDGDDVESCARLVTYAWRLTQTLLALGFPVRGAIAFGEFYVNPARQVFLGPALTAAYELEQQQEWSGVAFDPSVDPLIRGIAKHPRLQALTRFVVKDYLVPTKDGSRRLWTLNWRFNLVVKHGTKSLLSGMAAVPMKHSNTLAYAAAMRPTAYPVEERDTPIELRCYFVGDGPPPPNFVHGDEL